MFDKSKRVEFFHATVADVIKELSKLSAETKICFNGSELGYLHIDENDMVCSFDSEDLDDSEDYDDSNEYDWYGDEEPWSYEERNYQRLSDDYEDDSDRGCKDCPPDECTGHCMSCWYRPF